VKPKRETLIHKVREQDVLPVDNRGFALPIFVNTWIRTFVGAGSEDEESDNWLFFPTSLTAPIEIL
jgi:hypothetical protein